MGYWFSLSDLFAVTVLFFMNFHTDSRTLESDSDALNNRFLQQFILLKTKIISDSSNYSTLNDNVPTYIAQSQLTQETSKKEITIISGMLKKR